MIVTLSAFTLGTVGLLVATVAGEERRAGAPGWRATAWGAVAFMYLAVTLARFA